MNKGKCNCGPDAVNNDTYMDDLYNSCDCELPCNSCECVDLTGSCPPRAPVKCCPDKPKKNFWQLLFGKKKCSPCFRNKQDCGSKTNKKPRCKPCKEPGNQDGKDNECQSKAEACPRKGCIPTKYSVFGGHFYLNVENRPRGCPPTATKTANTNNPEGGDYEDMANDGFETASQQYFLDVNEAPVKDNQAGNFSFKNKRDSLKTERLSPYRKPPLNSPGFGYSERNSPAANPSNKTKTKRRGESVAFNPSSNQNERRLGSSAVDTDHRRKLSSRRRHTSFVNLPEEKSNRKYSCKRESRNKLSIGENDLPTEKPSKTNVQINLTVTKEETQYFIPNKSSGKDEDSGCGSKDVQNNNSQNNSDQVLTLEINNSGLKLLGKENKDVPGDPNNMTSTVDDFEEPPPKHVPRSESFAREVLPMMKHKTKVNRRSSKFLDIGDDEKSINTRVDTQQNRRSRLRSSMRCRKSSTANLDQRVSEILEKLNEIEKKISCIEKKEQDNKEIRVDFDGKKSSVSLHFKDPMFKDNTRANEYPVFKCNTSPKNGNKNAPTVIEIRQTKSKQNCSQENEPNLALEPCDAPHKNQANHKIVIKIPSSSTKTCVVLPENTSTKKGDMCKSQLSWYDIANELKTSDKCYCYKCLQDRVTC